MKRYGLIGYPLSHSFSPKFFTEKFQMLEIEAKYALYPLKNIALFKDLVAENDFSGLNVTIPHKEKILPFLDELSVEAQEIGAVNTIVFNNKKTIGHNTDASGFELMLQQAGEISNKKALVFGTGGASKAVIYVLKKHNIAFVQIGRDCNKSLTYSDMNEHLATTHQLWINTTPVGMYPNITECLPLLYQYLNEHHILFDLIYNPADTLFLKHGKSAGAKTIGGLIMLHEQAEAAWKLWQ